MNKLAVFMFCGATLLTANAGAAVFQGNMAKSTSAATQLKGASANTLSEAEAAGLLLMREEEKLARDVYTAFYNLHGLAIFDNISESEQAHMDAVKNLLDKYGLADPVAGMGYGYFASEEMQALYDALVERGAASTMEALLVGAMIEELDIVDLAQLQSELDGNPDIAAVYDNLSKGSRNHLRSFFDTILQFGGSYAPQYLSDSEFFEIVDSSMEGGSAK